MDIRLVAIDVDGTLLKTDKTLSSATARAIRRASARGVEVVLSTGRIYVEFAPLLTMLPTIRYAVSCTGASVLDCRTREELFSAPLPLEQARRAWRILREFDCLYEVFQDGMICVEEEKAGLALHYMEPAGNVDTACFRQGKPDFDHWIETQERPISKLHLYFRENSERDRALEALAGVDAYICASNPFDMEVMARGVDKGTGLSQLAAYLGLDHSQVMAVGDSGNDVGMMEFAGVRAVMANGETELKELADILTDSNDRDGVAKLLDALVLGQLEPGRQVAGHCRH